MSKNPTKRPIKTNPIDKWRLYTERKRQLETIPLSPAQYEIEIMKIADELGV